MNNYDVFHDVYVNLFNRLLDLEEKALITSEFKGISINDMHIIEAIGIEQPKNMSSVAKKLQVTVGTLTIAINSLVKKGYVVRVRSEEDRRVVLISLTALGERAFHHHMKFHNEMIQATLQGLSEEETQVMARALTNLSQFFKKFE